LSDASRDRASYRHSGRRWGIDDRRIDDRTPRNLQSLGCELPLHLVEQRPAQIVLLQQVAEATHCRLVRHRLAAEIDADEARIASES
jgi:hypothetical protein